MPTRTQIHFFGLFILIASLLTLSGCKKYGDVSPRAYEISKALYSACNRKSTEHLEQSAEIVEESFEEGEITESEQQWFREIISKAEGGDWKQAMLDARSMMEDQQE